MATVMLKTLHHWRCDICKLIGGVSGGTADTAYHARHELVTHFMDKHPSKGRNPTTIKGEAFSRHLFVLVDGLRLQKEAHGRG